MFLFNCATILCFVIFVHAATIPVEVRYEEKGKNLKEIAVRNLDERPQLNPEEELKLKPEEIKQEIKEEEKKEEPAIQVKNLQQEEPQQQPQNQEQPQQQPQKQEEPQKQEKQEEQPLKQQEEQPLIQQEQQPPQQPLRHLLKDVDEPKEKSKEDQPAVKKLEDQPQEPPAQQQEQQQPQQEEQKPQEEQQTSSPTLKSLSQENAPQEPSSNLKDILQQARKIVQDGLKQLKENIKAEKNELAPAPEQWESLEKSLNEIIDKEEKKADLKQSGENQNFLQAIVAGIQQTSSNFIQSLQGNQATQVQGDEGAGSGEQNQNQPFQNFVTALQGSVSNIVNAINNLGPQSSTQNTVLGDSESGASSPQPPTNILTSIANGFTQFVGNLQGGQQPPAAAQGDTGSGQQQQQQQGPLQQFGNAIGNIIQGRPPNASGDEGINSSTQRPNFVQSISNAVQNIFRPQGGNNNQNPVQAGIQNVQNQVGQLNPIQSSSSEVPVLSGNNQADEAPAKVQETPQQQKQEPEPQQQQNDEKKEQTAQ